MKKQYKIWGKKEDNALISMWGNKHFTDICNNLKRNHDSIKNRARKLGLKAIKKISHWSYTDDEDRFLIDKYGIFTCVRIAEYLKRSSGSIRARANLLGLKSELDQSKEARKKMGISMSEKIKNDPIYRRKILLAPLRKDKRKDKTRPELIVSQIVKFSNLEYTFIGNKKTFIGDFRPDFINHRERKIVEVFGNYWHNLPKVVERDKRKIEVYRREGYKVCIIWEYEIYKNPQKITEKLISFSSQSA